MPVVRAGQFWKNYYAQRRAWEQTPEGKAWLKEQAAEALARGERLFPGDTWERAFTKDKEST